MILTSGMLVVSCQSNTYDELELESVAVVVEKPSYVKDIEPLLKSNCITCHAKGTIENQSPYLTSYELAKGATANGNLICRIEGTCDALMPPSGKLPSSSINLIKLWKEQGYLEK